MRKHTHPKELFMSEISRENYSPGGSAGKESARDAGDPV